MTLTASVSAVSATELNLSFGLTTNATRPLFLLEGGGLHEGASATALGSATLAGTGTYTTGDTFVTLGP